jgi:fibrillarin-like pre-rRNA processing protein
MVSLYQWQIIILRTILIMEQIFPGVWKDRSRIMTRNLAPGTRGFSEELVRIKKLEYRVWNHNKSKLCAALVKGMKALPIGEGGSILYLGIASGQTASYISDIIGKEGVIYGVEISERSIRDLNPLAEKRGNIVPILGDSRKPEEYSWIEKVDLVYQDVATPDQPEILIRNARAFLKPGGHAMIAVKSRSIDVTREPEDIYQEVEGKLEKAFEILERIRLDPLEKDHCFFLLRIKPGEGA